MLPLAINSTEIDITAVFSFLMVFPNKKKARIIIITLRCQSIKNILK